MKHKLEYKIIAIFTGIILLIMSSYLFAYKTIYIQHEVKIMGEESMNTLHTIKSATLSLISAANNYSKIILSDEEIQRILNTGDIYSHFSNQSKVSRRMYNLFQFEENNSSVYFIDKKNQIFSIGERENLKKQLSDIREVSWYESLMKQNGGYLLVCNDENVGTKKINDQVYLLRAYKNMEDFSYLGIVGVGINVLAFQKTYNEILTKGAKEEIIFLDERSQTICQDGQMLLSRDSLLKLADTLKDTKKGELMQRIRINKEEYLLTGVMLKKQGWKILRILPMNLKQDSMEMMTTNIVMFFLSCILIIFGAAVVSRMMTLPIQSILFSMKQAEEGNFTKVANKPLFLNEFRYLFAGYNRMIEKIEQLIKQTIEEQQTIRKIELNEIQEQMKPHFLYNTLDSIEALAMMEEKEKVCEIVEALGNFYRKSVSKGRNMLTIDEEIMIAKDYIRIMKIRFEDLFIEAFTVDNRCGRYLIPKLTLQPIVENAIHHGLRGREEMGHLGVEISIQEGWLIISVTDDGSGISEEKLAELNASGAESKGKSIGLRGTIERLRIIYGDHFKFEVTSVPNQRTNVSLMIEMEVLEV